MSGVKIFHHFYFRQLKYGPQNEHLLYSINWTYNIYWNCHIICSPPPLHTTPTLWNLAICQS